MAGRLGVAGPLGTVNELLLCAHFERRAIPLMNPQLQHQRRRPRRRLSFGALLALSALLFFPALAMVRLARSVDPRMIGGYLTVISGATLWLYWHDKRQAESNGWRAPESTLHFAELFGGWPAAFLAQRAFRHKITKTSYQAAFWTIIALHQAASFDLLLDWRYARLALSFLRP